LLFASLLTIGQAFQSRRMVKTQPIEDKYQGNSFQLGMVWRVAIATLISTLLWSGVILVLWVVDLVIFGRDLLSNPPVVNVLIIFILPLVILVMRVAKHRLHALVVICLMVLFWIIITLNQIGTYVEAGLAAVAMIWVLPLILLSVAPAKAVSRRLIFLALGLLLLIALNEISKLGLDVTAPKLQG
jgi:hypothetical protein